MCSREVLPGVECARVEVPVRGVRAACGVESGRFEFPGVGEAQGVHCGDSYGARGTRLPRSMKSIGLCVERAC